MLIQLDEQLSAETVAALQRRGITIVGQVPVNGLVISYDRQPDFQGLPLQWAGPLPAAAKIGAAWNGSPASAVVEFHPDVEPADARHIAARHLLEVREVRGMARHHLFIRGDPDQIRKLAEWDEVAYIFPPSQAMEDGEEVVPCSGGISVDSMIGQYVKYGSGWPHAAGAITALTYTWGDLTNPLSNTTTQSEIRRALTEWTRYGNLTFNPGGSAGDLRNFHILFARGPHGDGYDFDGPGHALAHGFYPAPPNPETIAGDLHFDGDESWTAGPSGVDLFSVALHEAGHALGLAHSDVPTAVMYPYYRYVTALQSDDIAGIQDLYGAAVPAGPSATSVSPSSGSGSSQTFTFTYSDSAGYTNLTWVNLDIHTALTSAGACYVQYDRATNSVQLANNSGSAWVGSAVLGGTGVMQNSQCAVNLASSSAAGSGTTLTLSLAVTFKASFAGAKNIYMGALSGATFSGWQTRGSWTVIAAAQAPTVISVTPPSGQGASQPFTFIYSDSSGYANLNWVNLDFQTSVTSADACYVQYLRASNTVLLANDSGTAWAGSAQLGSVGLLQNSQCSIDLAASSATGSGNNLTLTLMLSFKPAFAGLKNIYMAALNNTSLFSGWQTMGVWTVSTAGPQPPVAQAVSPATGAGSSQVFSFTYADPAGWSALNWVNLNFHTTLIAAGGCYVQYERATNILRLANDAGTDWIGFASIGAGSTGNSQCTIDTGASSLAASGNNLTLTLAITFHPGFSGVKNIYMAALSNSGLFSGWQTRGSWTAP
jgi:hypothetical protein